MNSSSLEKMVETYVSTLAQETDEVKKSASFKEYLDCMALFWDYSFHNQILIHLQCRNASRIAGFRTWNKLGRSIKLGSKAIKILAPFKRKDKDEKEMTYFFPVNVFDISQTNGKDLPEINMNVENNNSEQYYNQLLSFCKSKNIHVEQKDLGVNGLYGYSTGGKIILDAKQNQSTLLNTLIHETAHELLHYQGKPFSKQEKEIQAEATTYVVTKALGLPNKSPTYLALYTKDNKTITAQLEFISQNVKEILTALVT